MLNSISSLFIGKNIQDWDDSDVIAFDKEVDGVIHRLEEFVLSPGNQESLPPDTKKNLAELAATRVQELRNTMVTLIGENDTRKLMEDIAGGTHGNNG